MSSKKTSQYYVENKTLINFILFIFILIVFPILIYRRYLISVNNETSDSLNKNYEVDTLNTGHKIFEDIIYTLPNIFMLFFLGNYKNTFSPISVIFILFFTIIYNYLVNLPSLNMNLDALLKSTTISATTAKGFIIIFLIFGSLSHIYLGYKQGILSYYIPIFIVVSFICLFLPYIIKSRDPTVRDVHLHHAYITYILAFFTRFDHPISKLFSSILLGVYVQGISAYGRIQEIFHAYKINFTVSPFDWIQ